MSQISNGNYDALAWVQTEVQQSLADALQIITRVIDDPAEINAMEKCITLLHQIDGIMEMLNFEGAKLLSSEILTCATALYRQNEENDATALQDAILKGLLLLPNYLKQISWEIPDHPLRLIETINQLRIARNESELSESSLFTANLSVILPDDIVPKPNKTTLKTN